MITDITVDLRDLKKVNVVTQSLGLTYRQSCDRRDERLQQETLCRRQWTDEYVERPETLMRQNVVVVWIQCLLVDVVRHAGMYVGSRACWYLNARTAMEIVDNIALFGNIVCKKTMFRIVSYRNVYF